MNQLLAVNPLIFHIIAGIGLFIAVYYAFRNRSLHVKMVFMYSGCAVSIVLGIIYLVVKVVVYHEHPLAVLPFHLCFISLFFTPLALRFNSKVLYDFIFYLCSLGAVFAIIFPSMEYIDGSLSFITFSYFSYHYLVTVIPLWLFAWKIYSPKVSFKDTLRLFVVLFSLGALMHGLNLLLVSHGVANANYFWTLVENGSRNNALLALFASILPVDFLYLVFVIPILYVYIGIWNLSLYLARLSHGKGQNAVDAGTGA